MATNPAEEESIKNQVREALRNQKVKLWTPPYVNEENEPVLSALEHLAKAWKTNRVLKSVNDDDIESSVVLKALQEWQSHALNKLQVKRQQEKSPTSSLLLKNKEQQQDSFRDINLDIKVLGWKGDVPSIETKQGSEAVAFATSVEVLESGDENKMALRPIRLSLKGVSSELTDVHLLEFIAGLFLQEAGAVNLRLVHRGKNIGDNKIPLEHLFQASLQVGNTVPLLCLASTAATRTTATAHDQAVEAAAPTIQNRIAAIRQAARQIRDTTKLEITDQHGNLVGMTGQDRLGFLTALALHRLGLNTTSKEEALVLLLEADVEWNNHPNLNVWKSKVDNYGLLQLDIAWIYLQLESLDNLPDSLKRLEEAERVLRSQVHKNFVTLALCQAENGNFKEVPPLAAVFAKLFLLQGIAYRCDSAVNHHHGNNPTTSAQKSRERLDQAFQLLQSLRSTTPEESVQRLLEVMQQQQQQQIGGAVAVAAAEEEEEEDERRQYTASDAIAALRKARGNMDMAANALTEEETKRRQRQRDRQVQHHHGLCQNQTDPVDLAQVHVLEPLLKGSAMDTTTSANNNGRNWALEEANTELAVGLLRLADNDLQRALEVYAQHDYNAYKVHALVDTLDRTLVGKGLLGRSIWQEKQKKRKLYDESAVAAAAVATTPEPPVDEMALVTLVSLGVDHGKARKALQANANDVDRSLMWLSTCADDGDDNGNEKNETAGANNNTSLKDDNSDHTPGLKDGNDDAMDVEEENEEKQEDGDDKGAQQQQQRTLQDTLEYEAQELLRRELGALEQEHDLEKEYLGKSLNEEWELVLKYRNSNN